VGLCHHDIVHPQVTGGREPPDMEGRCEYTESTVMDSQQGILSSLGIR